MLNFDNTNIAIKNIVNLEWKKVNIYDLMYISLVTAQEFANSLRLGMKELDLYKNKDFQLMYYGELMTNNLKFDDYNSFGDHYSFLFYFFTKNNLLSKVSSSVIKESYIYMKYVNTLSPENKIITIFDREKNLPAVFEKITKLVHFPSDSKFYEYYLKNHIILDSQENGHGDIVDKFYKATDNKKILDEYWLNRYNLYSSLLKK